eukprot:6660965-Pyramimonas_sp.AAC.1
MDIWIHAPRRVCRVGDPAPVSASAPDFVRRGRWMASWGDRQPKGSAPKAAGMGAVFSELSKGEA